MRRSVLMPVWRCYRPASCHWPRQRVRDRRRRRAARREQASSSSPSAGQVLADRVRLPTAACRSGRHLPGCPAGRRGAVRGRLCTLNFLRDSRTRSASSARGHCILATTTRWPVTTPVRRLAQGQGSGGQDSTGKRFGEFAYAVLQDRRTSPSSSRPRRRGQPEMCQYGGPKGLTRTSATGEGPALLRQRGSASLDRAGPLGGIHGLPHADTGTRRLALPGDIG